MQKYIIALVVFALASISCPGHAEESKTVTLKMAIYQPASHAFAKFYHAMVPEIEAITKGRIKIKIYDSSTVLKSTTMDEGIDKGVADIGFSYPPMLASTIPFLGLTDVPGIWRDTKGFNEAFDNGLTEIYEQAYHEGGLKNIKVIGLSNIGPWYVATTKKPFRVPADLKGLKIVGCGSMHVKFIDACGGTGMYIEVAERYESIQRGIVDGCTGFTSNFVGWKFMEPAEYMLDFAPSLGPMMIIMNRKSLEEKVPEDLREPLVTILKYMILAHRGVMAADTAYEHDFVMPKHMKYYKPTPEEEVLWIQAGKPLVEEWLSKTGDLGKKAMEIVTKYNAR